nr:hypothetical protein CTI12_AA250730 [Tanacetum cinerariifolium]
MLALHYEPSKSGIEEYTKSMRHTVRHPRTEITQATTQTPTITSSPLINRSAHKPNDVALPIGLSDIALRPRVRPHKIPNTTYSTVSPIIATTTSLLATPNHTNVFGSVSEVSNITPRPVGGPRKFQNTTHTKHTPTFERTPSLLATHQHLNVAASSSGVLNITPRTVGRPHKVQHTTPTTKTPMVIMTQSLFETPHHTNVAGSSVRGSNSTPRPRGRPRKIQLETPTTETFANTSTPACHPVREQLNIVESSNTISDISLRHRGFPRKVHIPTPTRKTPPISTTLKGKMPMNNHRSRFHINTSVKFNIGSTSATHQQKGKSVRIKSSRCINFNDTDEDEVESQSNPFEGISNEYRDHEDPIFGCESCGALLWHAECSNPPKLLIDIINRKHAKSTTFIDNIRWYNSMFAFTSMGGKQDKSVNIGRGPYCYRIQGMNYHRMGSLLLDKGKPLMFSQIYIHDTENEIQNRIKFVSNGESTSSSKKKTDHQLTTKIRDMFDTNNPLVAKFRMAGCPRYMMQNYLVAMTLCKNFRYPDLFITFTCNPNWPQIACFVAEKGLKSDDRPDVITRVFKQKFDSLMKDFKEKLWFGRLQGAVYTVEFQKIGLPDDHILLFLEPEDKLTTAAYIDKYISAKIPDKDEDPELYQIVTDHMMHGPCGAECPSYPYTINNKCTKKFPK